MIGLKAKSRSKVHRSNSVGMVGPIGLFKMFSHWILGFFSAQIHSERGHKFV